MLAHAPFVRQPFGEVSGQRLQHLVNIKNRQNGMLSTPQANCKSPLSQMMKSTPSPIASTKKRGYEATTPSDDLDRENVDPSVFLSPSKKAKGNDGLLKASTFSFSKPAPISMSLLRGQSVPKPITPKANISSIRTPSTAPAGRSPPRKTWGTANRRASAPYTRIDPPSACGPQDNLPFFSFEECLAGSLNRPANPAAVEPKTTTRNDVKRAMPKCWFFDIHEDTPDQEAENLMEHNTRVLDLSSDDKAQDVGKENLAPADYIAPVPAAVQIPSSGQRRGGKATQRRRKVVKKDQVDDGQRSPLSEVVREDFFPEGVTDTDTIIVAGDGNMSRAEAPATTTARTPSPVSRAKKSSVGDIVIFED